MTNTLTIDQALQQAVEHHTQGQLQEAEDLYRAILQVQPGHPDANNNLGVLAVQLNQPVASLPYFKAAIDANPNQGQYWRRYIDALIQAGQIDVARQTLEQGRQRGLQGEALDAAIARLEDGAQTAEQSNTEATKETPVVPSIALQNSKKKSKNKLGKRDKSAKKTAFNKAKNPSPQEIDTLVAQFNEGRYTEAISLAEDMTERFPQYGFGWKALGAMYKQLGRNADALVSMQKSAALSPDDAEAHCNLGFALHEQGQLDEAETSCRLALKINPNYAGAHYNLGNTLQEMGRMDEAEASIRRALEIKPDYAVAHCNLGNIIKDLGRFEDAEVSFRRALQIKPDLEVAFNNFLFTLNYHPDKSGEEIFAAYRDYDAKFGLPYRTEWRLHGNSLDTQRRLKVGYVSPDFWHHSVRHFLEPLLAHHDKQAVEVYAYANLAREDLLTARYKTYVDHWIPCRGLSDTALAERIRADGIDILVDLAGHTAQNRLQVFARKPAPVSVSWLGYGCTTGLTAIDYYLGDEASTPVGCETVFSEQPWRIETPALVYRPAEGMGEVSALPALERGYVTFGTLTRAIRINHRTLRVWAELLKRVPGSRLVIDSGNFKYPVMQEMLAEKFAVLGIGRDRLEIGHHSPPWDTMRKIDIGLDCFPHNSGTTLIENLYMGLPFVTLAGRPSVGCIGKMILQGTGHPEWVANSEEEYIEIAARLASDLGRLARLRAGLRSEMQSSPLMDESAFARKVENAYREMWLINCEKRNVPDSQEINTQAVPCIEEACAEAVSLVQSMIVSLEDSNQVAEQSKAENQAAANESQPVSQINKKKSKNKLGKLDKSAKKTAFNKGKNPSPQEIDTLVTLFSEGRYTEAISLAEDMTECFPQHGFGWKALGAMFKQLGRNEDALVPMQKAAALSPDDAEAHCNLGFTLHELGRLDEAETSYRRALKIKPAYAEAHRNRGNTLMDMGRLDEAEVSYRRALELKPNDSDTYFNLGNILKSLGRLDEAVASYLQTLDSKPDHIDAYNNLGLILNDMNRLDEAEACFRRALEINPDYAEAYGNLGNTLTKMERLDEAEAMYRQALEINSNIAVLHFNLGHAFNETGRLDEAETCYRRAVEIDPDYVGAHNNLGDTLKQLGRLDEAEACFRRTLEIKPDYAEAHNNLGNILQNMGRLEDAEVSCRRALAIKPDYADAHNNLANILLESGRLDEAEASYRRALQTKPDLVDALSNLSVILNEMGRLDEAEDCCRRALSIKPDYAEAHISLADILNRLGLLDESEASFWRALQIKPDFKIAFNNFLFTLNYHPDKSGEEIFAAYRDYDAKFGLPYMSEWRPHSNSLDSQRRLKVGYVSPDFRQHSVRHFLEPLLAHHDKQAVEVYAYANLASEDLLTARYKTYVDHWIPCRGLSDAALAERIRADGIDILVDLAGHTAQNRLQVFARKPAPVSVSWLGYGCTTGLTAIDYYLGDEASTPVGCETVFSEQPWRIETPSLVYRPAEGMGEVNALPALERGYVTFGTLTRAIRINYRTLRVWAELLKRVPGSRLVIDSRNFKHPKMQSGLADKFAALGIGRDRLEIGHHSPPWDTMRKIDIGLDCFPHNSGTTLIENLYMGLPFVTLAGRPSVGCIGKMILQGTGHPEWVANSEEEYIEIAAGLASDLGRLAGLRAGLRGEMQASALMNEPAFARKVENAYREMWLINCEKRNASGSQEINAQAVPYIEEANAEAAPPLKVVIAHLDDDVQSSNDKAKTEPDKQAGKLVQHKGENPSPQEIDTLVTLFNEGRYTEAISLAEDMTERFPRHGFGWKALGAMFKQLGRNEDALAPMQKAAALSPDDAEAHSNLGSTLQELNRLDEAIASYRRALNINPDYADAYFNLGSTLNDLGRLDEAEASYRRALNIEPNYAEAHYNLSNIIFKDMWRLNEAEAGFRQVLKIKPDHAEACNNLGLILKKLNRLDEAEACFLDALQINPDYAEAHSNLGNVLMDMGRLDEAEASYRRALEIASNNAELHYNLGIALKTQGRPDKAELCYRRALEIEPDYVGAHGNLGNILVDMERFDEAEVCFRRILELKPDYVEIHGKLGNILVDLGRLEEAESCYRLALEINPDLAEVHSNLGNIHKNLGRLDEAETSYRRALEIKPDLAEAHSNLGNVLNDLGRQDEAEVSCRMALAIKPDYAEAHSNLANALKELGRLGEAEASYRQSLEIKPFLAEAQNNLSIVLHDLGRLDEAEVSYRQALQIKPDYAEVYSNLGNTLKDLGRAEEAEVSFRQALQMKSDFEVALSNLLFALNYHPDKSGEEIFAAYRDYDAKFGLPYMNEWRPHSNNPETNRRLKVGYVSPDFRQHSVRHFLEPLLAHHDKQAAEVYAYADVAREDLLTARYKTYVDHWIPTRGLSDAALAERIRADGIDILVDLAGHTAKNRLQVFARKPAPVSVSWLGYGCTTGLTAIDYYLGDEVFTPVGCEKVFSEQPWRIETPALVYRPAEGMGEVNALPALERGYVTFGMLTRAVRINHRTLRVWTQLLKRVPGSCLVIDSGNFKYPAMQEMLAEKFAALGIDRNRLEIGYHTPPWDTLRSIDIGLDCFPHNSGTTLYESLYMGLPFVTLAGRPSVGCLGKMILQGIGRPEWVANSEEEYIEIAAGLASDLGQLARLRAGLRNEMQASPLMDEPAFARKVENAYREMWLINCEKGVQV